MSTTNYVDKRQLHQHLVTHLEACKANPENKPKLPDYVALAIVNIANGLSYRYNFINYSYKDEMVGDAIEVCLRYLHNYNPQYNNPFGYFTKICFQCFVERIKKEKNQHKIRRKMLYSMDLAEFDVQDHDLDEDFKNQFTEFMREHTRDDDDFVDKKKARQFKGPTLESFFDEELPEDEMETQITKMLEDNEED